MAGKFVGAILFNLLGVFAYITAWINSVETWKHLIMFVIGVVFLCMKTRIYYFTMLEKQLEYKEKKAQSEYSLRKLKREEDGAN